MAKVVGAMTVFLVRHAHAGERARDSHDLYRQLSERGHKRALQLVDMFATRPIIGIVTSPATRCVQTVEPLARRHDLPIIEDGDLWEAATVAEAFAAIERLVDPEPGAEEPTGDWVVCSHGNLIPEMVGWLAGLDMPVRGRGCEKGSVWALERNDRCWTGATYLGLDRSPDSRHR